MPSLSFSRHLRTFRRLAGWVLALAGAASAATLPPITLAWDANPEPDIAGYDLSYGTSSGSYSNTINAGKNTSTPVSGLTAGVRYYFSVVAYNTAGLRSVASDEISYQGTLPTTNQAPDSTISSPSPNLTITAGDSVSFTGGGTDPDGDTPLGFRWSFGGGSGIPDSTAQNPGSRQFNNQGTYQVTLTVTDSKGLADPTPAQVTVTVNPPVLANQAPDSTISSPSSNLTITAGDSVSFAGSGSDPDGDTQLSYLWSFGGGSGIPDSTAQNPGSRQFNNVGIYQVTLTVTDSKGLADPSPAQRTVTVKASSIITGAPDGWISEPSADTTIVAGQSLAFSAGGIDGKGSEGVRFSWKFGTGSGVPDSNVSKPVKRRFEKPGTYVVTLTASDSNGVPDPSPATRTITVLSPIKTVSRSGWSLRYVDSEDPVGYAATRAFDGNSGTFWHTEWREKSAPPPHEIQIDLGGVHELNGFRYLPRQDGYIVGNIAKYRFYTSMDGVTWGRHVASGRFTATPAEKQVLFPGRKARYVRLVSLSGPDGTAQCNVAELNLLESP